MVHVSVYEQILKVECPNLFHIREIASFKVIRHLFEGWEVNHLKNYKKTTFKKKS